MATYEVIADDAYLWSQSYTMHPGGGLSSGERTHIPLERGEIIELVDRRPTSPGSDVVDSGWFRRSTGESGFLSPTGPWGIIDEEVVRKVGAYDVGYAEGYEDAVRDVE